MDHRANFRVKAVVFPKAIGQTLFSLSKQWPMEFGTKTYLCKRGRKEGARGYPCPVGGEEYNNGASGKVSDEVGGSVPDGLRRKIWWGHNTIVKAGEAMAGALPARGSGRRRLGGASGGGVTAELACALP